MNDRQLTDATLVTLVSELHQLDKDIHLLEDRIFESCVKGDSAQQITKLYNRKQSLREYEQKIVNELIRRLAIQLV